MTSTTRSTVQTASIPADAYRAFADYLSAGNTGSFDEWYASDAGKTALLAFEDQAKAAEKAARMADAKAMWRDFKNNGQITMYAKAHALRLVDYLATVDFDAIQPEATEVTEDTDSK